MKSKYHDCFHRSIYNPTGIKLDEWFYIFLIWSGLMLFVSGILYLVVKLINFVIGGK